jgi:hypothetical protein
LRRFHANTSTAWSRLSCPPTMAPHESTPLFAAQRAAAARVGRVAERGDKRQRVQEGLAKRRVRRGATEGRAAAALPSLAPPAAAAAASGVRRVCVRALRYALGRARARLRLASWLRAGNAEGR